MVIVEKFLCESNYRYQDGDVTLSAYLARVLEGEICLTVHDQIRWVNAKEIKEYNLLPADKPIAERIIKLGYI